MSGILRSRQVVNVLETRLAQGYSNAEFVGELIMPRVTVGARYGNYLIFGKEGQKTYNTLRGVGADAERINLKYDTATYEIPMTHALEAPIDDEEVEQAAQVSQADLVTQARVTIQDSMLLEREKEIAKIVTNVSNYTITRPASTAWTDPDADIMADIKAGKQDVRRATGMYPDTLTVSALTFDSMTSNQGLLDKIKYTQMGVLTTELMASLLGLKQIIVGPAVYTDDEDVTTDVWGTSFAALIQVGKPQSAGVLLPTRLPQSFGYVLQLKGYPIVKQYREERKDSTIVKLKEGWIAKQTSTVGGCFFTGTLAV